MASTSCEQIAREVLVRCLAGRAPDRLPRKLSDPACAPALFGILAEGLGDRFDPALCDIYAQLFPQVIPGADAERYFRVRVPRPFAIEPRRIFVLSRITLGADIAVTSVIMDAAKRRFPGAEVVFVGPRKNWELFGGPHAPLGYHRDHYLDVWRDLQSIVGTEDLVLDPDSRLTQLGLLPVSREDRYHLFESRSYGGTSNAPLSQLAAEWAGVPDARPYLAIERAESKGAIAVSLGVGENPAKRLPDPFEEDLLRLLAERGPLMVDRGAGGEEAARVERAVQRAGIRAEFWDGSFAGFVRHIAAASLYVGYDSAGQHAAAALGVPQICIFAGFPTLRMFQRWRPVAPNATVIRVEDSGPEAVMARVRQALPK